jgi:hypothetical protein
VSAGSPLGSRRCWRSDALPLDLDGWTLVRLANHGLLYINPWKLLFKNSTRALAYSLSPKSATLSAFTKSRCRIGLAAAAIAKNHGAFVAATTRNADPEKLLRASGVDQVFIDTGSIAAQVKEVCPNAVDKVLELVGTTTLKDSLRCANAASFA